MLFQMKNKKEVKPMRTFLRTLVFFLSLSTSLTAGLTCPYGCANAESNPRIRDAQYFFNQFFWQINLLRDGFSSDREDTKEVWVLWEPDHDTFEDEDYFTYDLYAFDRECLGSEKHFSIKSFNFSTYINALEALFFARQDIYDFYNGIERKYARKIEKIKKKIINFEASYEEYCNEEMPFGYISNPKEFKKDLLNDIAICQKMLRINAEEQTHDLDLYFNTQTKIDSIYKTILNRCIRMHQWTGTYYERGFLHFHLGEIPDSLDDIKTFIDRTDPEDLPSETFLTKGQIESEAGLYQEAVISLSAAIEKNPQNSAAYFERAAAYFELENFDLSLKDYLASGIKPQPLSSEDLIPFSLGLTKGILKGGVRAGEEFIPNLYHSLQGLSEGLWALAKDPVQVSKEFVQAAEACADYVRTHTPQETLTKLVPELQELINGWDTLGNEQRGEIIGNVIGSYGVEIFAGAGITKVMKAYRELKMADRMLTFEAMAKSETNKSLLKLEAAARAKTRKEVLQHGNLKVLPDRQGKHLVNHKNYQLKRNRSIVADHNDLQEIANELAGTGIRDSNALPGRPGYKEIVNVKKFFGWVVNPKTGEKTETTWAKIHYSKDGIHFVPTLPRK